MSLATPIAPWVAVQVRYKKEQAVADRLEYKGYECFLPLSRAAAVRGRQAFERPLFPGYVFCRYQTTASAPIVTTPGVTRIVSFGKAPLDPAYIKDDEIDAIRRAVESGLAVVSFDSFQPGAEVFIAEGPLQGIRGRVLETNEKQYLVVSIHLLQRSIKVELDPRWVRLETPRIVGRLAARSDGAGKWPHQTAS